MMIKRLTAMLLMLLCVMTAAAAMSLDEAERTYGSRNKTELFQSYDTFKAAYLKATLNGNDALKKRALKGIVNRGHQLHIDVSSYEAKLRTMAPRKAEPKVTSVAKKRVRTVTPVLRGQNRLSDVRWERGKLIFRFEKPLGSKDVNYFKLKKTKTKGYRYVFDVHAVLNRSHTLTHRDLKRISLSQYKPSTMRLVLESSRVLPVRFSIKKDTLTIRAGIAEVTSPKSLNGITKKRVRRHDKVIVIDPGHGGKDCGAIGYKKCFEKNIVLAIASKTAELLRARGYTVLMTRSDDRFIKLRNRTRFANRKKADLFISIHANAVPKKNAKKAYGIETYFLSPSRSKRATHAAASENKAEVEDMDFYGKNTFLNALNSEKIVASHKLAIDLQSSVLSSLRARYKNVKDSGVREGPFWVLVGAQMPAVLIEVGFITHPTESARLISKTYQDYFARGLADGVENYFAKNR